MNVVVYLNIFKTCECYIKSELKKCEPKDECDI